MTKVKITRTRDSDHVMIPPELKVLNQTTVEVLHRPGSSAVIQMIFESEIDTRRSFYVLLSLPNAKRIAKNLQNAVNSYLNDPQETEKCCARNLCNMFPTKTDGLSRARATSMHDTQQQAINVAREIVLIQQSELVIHRRDGRIRDKDSHGNNPFRSKD